MKEGYTFSVVGKDKKTYYPKHHLMNSSENIVGVGVLDFEWTNDINEAIIWPEKQSVEIIMAEFCDAELIKYDECQIKVTNKSDRHKFVSFRIKGLEDGILVGLTYPDLPLDDPKQGLSIAYKGDLVIMPFKGYSCDVPSDSSLDIFESAEVNQKIVEESKNIFTGIQNVEVDTKEGK